MTKVGTQGRQETGQWVTEYTVSYSLDGGFYKFFKQANYDVVKVSLRHKCRAASLLHVLVRTISDTIIIIIIIIIINYYYYICFGDMGFYLLD